MTSKDPLSHSADGSRPTTDGGVANIGAGEKLATGRAATGEPNNGPANPERMREKRSDAAAMQRDDAVPLGLHAVNGLRPTRTGAEGGRTLQEVAMSDLQAPSREPVLRAGAVNRVLPVLTRPSGIPTRHALVVGRRAHPHMLGEELATARHADVVCVAAVGLSVRRPA